MSTTRTCAHRATRHAVHQTCVRGILQGQSLSGVDGSLDAPDPPTRGQAKAVPPSDAGAGTPQGVREA